MSKRYLHTLILFVMTLGSFVTQSALGERFEYPNFYDHPYLNDYQRASMIPYLLPVDHPMKATLDGIFSQSRVLQDEKSLLEAGFTIIAGPMPISFVVVTRHPLVPGYVFKMYLDSDTRSRVGIPHWVSLVRRCSGAAGIRSIIQREKIRHFLVPDKWLYVPPAYPFSNVMNPEPVIVMETDMELESHDVTKKMWKTVGKKHLDELFAILKHGYGGGGTSCLSINVPYTKHGKFAFTDTESPKMHLKLRNVKKYISRDMHDYWDSLIKNHNR